MPPVYTIIAHSLGSVLSFDALVYAFAKGTIRDGTGRHITGCLPFPGYTEQEDSNQESWLGLLSELRKEPRCSSLPTAARNWADFSERYSQFGQCHGARLPDVNVSPTYQEIPLLLWRNHVKHLITLGSPIDKFVTLWHHNYRHLGLSHHSFPLAWGDDWLEDSPNRQRISHYNLCDEQDPVGHHLDTTLECPNYGKIFNATISVTYRDVVFRRYAVPGLAHVQYWEDQQLFDRVISEVIDRRSPLPENDTIQGPCTPLGQFVEKEFVEVEGVYDMALVWAYARIPLVASIVTGLLVSYGWIGWWYWGFSLSSATALFAGILLWACPRPFEVYREEVKTEYVTGLHWLKKQMPPWWPRQGIFANFVAGAVAWRRILILLNDHPNQESEVDKAINGNVRLSLKTAGNFNRLFRRRIMGGVVLFLLAAIGTWQGCTYLSTAADSAIKPPAWYVAILSLLTLSTVYLMTMGYVGYIFKRMKKAMTPEGDGRSPSDSALLSG